MNMIIDLLHDSFKHASIPSSNYEAKKLLNKLGLHYNKTHVCLNDYMLYWGENGGQKECKKMQEIWDESKMVMELLVNTI